MLEAVSKYLDCLHAAIVIHNIRVTNHPPPFDSLFLKFISKLNSSLGWGKIDPENIKLFITGMLTEACSRSTDAITDCEHKVPLVAAHLQHITTQLRLCKIMPADNTTAQAITTTPHLRADNAVGTKEDLHRELAGSCTSWCTSTLSCIKQFGGTISVCAKALAFSGLNAYYDIQCFYQAYNSFMKARSCCACMVYWKFPGINCSYC